MFSPDPGKWRMYPPFSFRLRRPPRGPPLCCRSAQLAETSAKRSGERGKRSWSIHRPPRKQCGSFVCGNAVLRGTGSAHPVRTLKSAGHRFQRPPHSGHLDTDVSRCAARRFFSLDRERPVSLFCAVKKEKWGVHSRTVKPCPLALLQKGEPKTYAG